MPQSLEGVSEHERTSERERKHDCVADGLRGEIYTGEREKKAGEERGERVSENDKEKECVGGWVGGWMGDE